MNKEKKNDEKRNSTTFKPNADGGDCQVPTFPGVLKCFRTLHIRLTQVDEN
jgi:hypothetical protein